MFQNSWKPPQGQSSSWAETIHWGPPNSISTSINYIFGMNHRCLNWLCKKHAKLIEHASQAEFLHFWATVGVHERNCWKQRGMLASFNLLLDFFQYLKKSFSKIKKRRSCVDLWLQLQLQTMESQNGKLHEDGLDKTCRKWNLFFKWAKIDLKKCLFFFWDQSPKKQKRHNLELPAFFNSWKNGAMIAEINDYHIIPKVLHVLELFFHTLGNKNHQFNFFSGSVTMDPSFFLT